MAQTAQTDVILPTEPARELPVVRSIGLSDLTDALAKGVDDFRAMPTHVLFLSLIYPLIGLALAGATFGYNFIPLLYPLAAGFALIGPIAAIGLYELSRRRELGIDTSWKHVFDVAHSPSLPSIAALGAILLVIFSVWLAVADAIYIANFGPDEQIAFGEFMRRVFTTPEGQRLIVVGNAVGFLFAVLAFALSLISFPLLLDRNVGVAVAIITSIKAILRNPADDGAVGLVRGWRPGDRLAAVLYRPRGGHADPWPFDLAPLSQGRRAGSEPAAGVSPAPTRRPLRGGFPCLTVCCLVTQRRHVRASKCRRTRVRGKAPFVYDGAWLDRVAAGA